MVDRITKILPDHARVEASRDATDEEKTQGGPLPDEEEKDDGASPDAFQVTTRSKALDLSSSRIDLPVLEKRLELPIHLFERVIFHSINTKPNPAILGADITLKDGRRWRKANLVVPRHKGILFQGLKGGTEINLSEFAQNEFISVFVPERDDNNEEESTRISPLSEGTFSQTLKKFLPKTWLERLGLWDFETKKPVGEIVLAYSLVVVVLLMVLFAAFVFYFI